MWSHYTDETLLNILSVGLYNDQLRSPGIAEGGVVSPLPPLA